MLITRECDYAVRILRALSTSTILNVQRISSDENIPVQYTYKICHKLAKAGILKSYRGITGGYALNKSSEEMTLYDIFNAVDSDPRVSDCTQSGNVCENNTCDHPCKIHLEFCRLQQTINQELKSKKLSELF